LSFELGVEGDALAVPGLAAAVAWGVVEGILRVPGLRDIDDLPGGVIVRGVVGVVAIFGEEAPGVVEGELEARGGGGGGLGGSEGDRGSNEEQPDVG
jgi:hypothetical protein